MQVNLQYYFVALFFAAECEEPHSKKGRCRALFHSWTYVQETNKCEEFVYGGCSGNGNRFDTAEQCIEHCIV
ncbi:hypothetical protein KR093_001372 [Drosophila rubida]|uniref:BPTI/Kunitz inhibitor domain-containing protein n=1 Tax=Drosophila rubida TaxID=30044 RepID=A0AAD4K636_9MUSC|nr:hypothetical protein KR093_001372 [Drosophila rubida]